MALCSASFLEVPLPVRTYKRFLRLVLVLLQAFLYFWPLCQVKKLKRSIIYIDDLLIITKGTYEEHIKVVEQVLQRMKGKDLQINIDKSHFAVQEVEYLGYILSREGIRPQPKKVQAILDMVKPNTSKQLRGFIGKINFYRDLFRGRAHYLAPLTSLLKGVKRGPIK